MAHEPDELRAADSPDRPEGPHRPESMTAADVDHANHDVEPDLMRRILVDIAIAVPVAIAVIVGMVTVAVSIDGAALEAPILMAVAIGVLAGVFFGAWAGFVSTAHGFEELDRMYGPTPQQ